MSLSYKAKKGNLLPRVAGLRQEIAFDTRKMDKSLARILSRIEASFDLMVKLWKIAGVSVTSVIIEKTPKDLGAAKASWKAPRSKQRTDGFEVHIASSGVEYIVFLEFGTSKQAPQGMVRITLNEFVRALPQFGDKISRFIQKA